MDIRSSDDIRESLKFIMKSSTNGKRNCALCLQDVIGERERLQLTYVNLHTGIDSTMTQAWLRYSRILQAMQSSFSI